MRRALDKSGYLSEDTISALASAAGGAVAIVRVSGPRALASLESLTEPGFPKKLGPRKLHRAMLKDGAGSWIDDALVVVFPGPKSYTGEDCVEYQIHGGPFIATRLLEALSEQGVRQALAGEFSFRAVRNGKCSLSQAEAVADLIAASNDSAISLALEKMSGSQNRFVGAIADELRRLAMLSEVGIDFSDQDVDEVSLPTLKRKIEPLIEKLQRLGSSYSRGARIQEGLSVAFIGLPNAGKSSFFNALLGEDRSIVSEVAGTTRDVVRERLTLRGPKGSVTLRLEDTAGLRPSDDKVERMGIERSHLAARGADLVLLIVDCSSSLNELQHLESEWKKIGADAMRTLGILTKSDLGGEDLNTLHRQLESGFGLKTWVKTSAVSGEGISEAADRIIELCSVATSRERGEVVLTRLDHVQAVAESVDHLMRASGAPELDLFASDVRHSLKALSPLIGETLPDDILGQIFSKFCIGK